MPQNQFWWGWLMGLQKGYERVYCKTDVSLGLRSLLVWVNRVVETVPLILRQLAMCHVIRHLDTSMPFVFKPKVPRYYESNQYIKLDLFFQNLLSHVLVVSKTFNHQLRWLIKKDLCNEQTTGFGFVRPCCSYRLRSEIGSELSPKRSEQRP
jgi:hypothetical protein